MIVVKVELHSAITHKVTTLATAIISNKGTGTKNRGDYDVKIGRAGTSDLVSVYQKPQRTGSVENYPRLSYSVWRLVIRALRSAFPEES